jgi:hypothetical protein
MPSDIPLKVLPDESPDVQTYTIALPTRFDDNGNVEAFEFPKSTPVEVAMAQIREGNKRDAADTQIQKMLDPEYRKNLPFDDFKQWKHDERVVGDTTVDLNLLDLFKDGAKELLKGAYNTAKNFSEFTGAMDVDAPQSEQRKAARAGLNIIEGGLQGTERLADLAGVAGLMAAKNVSKLFSDADRTDEIDYQLYQKAIQMEETQKKRSSGDFMVDQAAKSMGIQLPPIEKSDIEASNSISNFLDASMLAGPLIGKGVGMLVGKGAQTALAKMAPSAIANLAGRAAMTGAEYGGKAIDFATKKIVQGVDQAMQSIAQNAQTRGAMILGGMAVAEGVGIAGLGSGFFKTAILGKGLRSVGEIGGTVLRAAADDIPLRGALRELTETTGSDVVRFLARQSLKVAPPDSVFDALKHVAAASVNTGFVSGSLNAMHAAAAHDDPVQGFMEGFASGAGGGAVLGLAGVKGAVSENKIRRVTEFFDNDIRGRQPEVALNIDGQEVRINDAEGRVELFNRSDMSPEQKQFTLQLTQAVERGGGNVIFHNGSPEVTQALEGVGMGAGEGVTFFNDADGRTTVILNAREMVPGTAVEEAFHAMTTDAIVKEVSNAINFNIKADATRTAAAPVAETPGAFAPRRKGAGKETNYLGDAMDFTERYIRMLEASGMESGRAKAAELRQRIARVATDPEMMPDIKADILKPIIEEYAANYARAALAGMKPRNLMEGGLRNLWDVAWDKTMGNLLSAFDMSKQGARKDPITGHFFDERGKRVINPQLESLVDRFLSSASENLKKGGKKVNEIMPENTVDGVYYFDVRSEKPFISFEDTIDGRQTTPKEKKEKLNAAFKTNMEFVNSVSSDDNVVVVNSRLKEDGAFPGNIIKVKDGTPLIFTQGAPESFFDHLARTGQIDGDQVTPNKYLNRAMVAGHIITVDAIADIGRNLKDRSEVYYGRGNRAFLPISMQQLPSGGVTWQGLDVTRVWNYTKRASRKIKAVREELKARDIVSLQEFIPYLQQYFDNYSSPNPIPAAELKNFSPVMRDIISTALNISNRVSFGAEDAARFRNQHTFNADLVGREGANISTAYRKGTITYREQMEGLAGAGRAGKVARLGERQAIRTVMKARESVSLLQIRADRIMGVSDFTIGGAPVPIKYNPYRVTNLVRANFSPGRTVVEQLGDSNIFTDPVSEKRIIVKPNGKATLFDGDRKSIHENLDDAIQRANINASRDDVMFAPKRGKARKAEPTPEEQLKFDTDSTINAFENTSLPARALSDKITRLYQNGSIALTEMNQALALLNSPDISYTGARQASAEFTRNALKNMELYRQGLISRVEMKKTLAGMEAAEGRAPSMASPEFTQEAARNAEMFRKGLISTSELKKTLKSAQGKQAARDAKASAERRARLAQMENEFLPPSAKEEVADFMIAQRNAELVQSQFRARKEEARAFAREQAAAQTEAAPPVAEAQAEQVVVQDPRIPRNIRITRTPTGKYRVFYGSRLVGVKEQEEKAIQLAQRYAAN